MKTLIICPECGKVREWEPPSPQVHTYTDAVCQECKAKEPEQRREVKKMRGIAGTTEYLNVLMELYDEELPIGTVVVLEMVRLAGCTYNEALGHFDMERKATEASHTHDHPEGRVEERG